MASGHRKRKAALLYTEVLSPAGYTNIAEADRGNGSNQTNLLNIAQYSANGYTPTFTAGSTTLLSDSVSNADGAWTAAGLTGETTNVGAFAINAQLTASGFLDGGKHYSFPPVGSAQLNYSSSGAPNSPIIIYSNDGPQSEFVPYYLGGTAATASIKLGAQITGSGAPKYLYAYVGGELASGDIIRFLDVTGTVLQMSGVSPVSAQTSIATASAAELTANGGKKIMMFRTGSFTSGLIVEYSSSAKTSTTPVAGIWVVISSGSTP
jgi:hypothetical protein